MYNVDIVISCKEERILCLACLIAATTSEESIEKKGMSIVSCPSDCDIEIWGFWCVTQNTKKAWSENISLPFLPEQLHISRSFFFESKSLPRYITAFLSPQIPKEMFWLIPTIFISCQFSTEGAGIWDLAPGLMTLSRFSLRWPCGYYCHLYSLPDLVLFLTVPHLSALFFNPAC